MTTSPSDPDKVWFDECPDETGFFGADYADEESKAAYFMWDGENPFVRVHWITYAEFVQMYGGMPLEIGRIDGFRFIESPLAHQPDVITLDESTIMKQNQHVTSDSKRGRQLNSKKVKRSGNSYRGRPPGEKELERGARSYMVASRTNGHPIVQTMSKKQFDRDVHYAFGEGE